MAPARLWCDWILTRGAVVALIWTLFATAPASAASPAPGAAQRYPVSRSAAHGANHYGAAIVHRRTGSSGQRPGMRLNLIGSTASSSSAHARYDEPVRSTPTPKASADHGVAGARAPPAQGF